MMIPKKFNKKLVILAIIIGGFAGVQLVQPQIENPPVTADFSAPSEVKEILVRGCYDCHSNETKLQWFDKIIPAYWLVKEHVEKGRLALNFSNWDSLSHKQQNNLLYTALNFILLKSMPPDSYTLLHPQSKVSESDLKILKNYARILTPEKPSDSSNIRAANHEYDEWINTNGASVGSKVKPAPNGISYITGFDTWTAISTTDRFDNGTMRVIYANDVAVKAIKNNHINPWPKGTIFAKVLWKKLIDSSGNVRTGKFVHVEFMIKDADKYAGTDGWGWARWVGKDLKPYGKSTLFTTECTNCHKPMKNNDFVFTMPLQLKSDK
jgi:hypothetical protein